MSGLSLLFSEEQIKQELEWEILFVILCDVIVEWRIQVHEMVVYSTPRRTKKREVLDEYTTTIEISM